MNIYISNELNDKVSLLSSEKKDILLKTLNNLEKVDDLSKIQNLKKIKDSRAPLKTRGNLHKFSNMLKFQYEERARIFRRRNQT